ncbi:MAG: hypothetical protein ACN4GR_03500 [Arenicellales bacterium]
MRIDYGVRMRRLFSLVFLVSLSCLSTTAATEISAGDPATVFSLLDQDGKQHRLVE